MTALSPKPPLHAAAIAIIALVCLSASLLDRSAEARNRSRPTVPWLIGGTPVFPPPSPHLVPLLPRFFVLYESYVALDGDPKFSFAAWVMANGITDPWMIAGMVRLYDWWCRVQGA
ncbi:MAG TPA: hypothetical protein PKC43_01555 [Phycisphaerales bacterium]|nr:hypothetical protein [Phycisphaerales bacterium]HMP36111.1 hypothetical protein [Phycisphaerales bacterium]